ncbi:hypothetical protein J6590_040694 [Homalodisca vitripennis]|nr:hypothetical protein J6590_040694 [Homalodisca vitripennis]
MACLRQNYPKYGDYKSIRLFQSANIKVNNNFLPFMNRLQDVVISNTPILYREVYYATAEATTRSSFLWFQFLNLVPAGDNGWHILIPWFFCDD